MNDKIITNPDDIFFYFEMIRNADPKSILDAGMFLKRIGAVSRQAMSYEIGRQIRFDGIDFFSEAKLAVYQSIYNNIYQVEDFLKNGSVQENRTEKYDLTVMLRMPDFLTNEQETKIWEFALWNTQAIMTDARTAQKQVGCGKIRAFYQVAAGNGQYAWIPTAELRVADR